MRNNNSVGGQYSIYRLSMVLVFAVLTILWVGQALANNDKRLYRIGSKAFAESYILAEISAQLMASRGYLVERKMGLGGTLIAYQALLSNEIDFYPEYTGTISQTILKQSDLNSQAFFSALKQKNLLLLAEFGFNNSYAIAISSDLAKENNIHTISDLALHPNLPISFSLEFLNRDDGWPGLKQHYRLAHQVKGIEHALAYAAIKTGQLAATDAYTTDGDIDLNVLRLLEDDRNFFPTYYAALLARSDLPVTVIDLLNQLSGRIDEKTMQALNQRVSLYNEKPDIVARDFLLEQGLIDNNTPEYSGVSDRVGGNIIDNTLTHLKLTIIALGLACFFAIPLALFLSQTPTIAKVVLYLTGLVQTIPSLAMLALMIPIFGLGELPAVIALFLYSLLPIIRNTLSGIFTVDPLLKQVATGMGLTSLQKMWKIELPLAVPQLIAGVKTAAIISIGTATLAAFVGAGGLGEPIITGLTLNDHRLILQGAIPAALLAIVTEFVFEVVERVFVPRHFFGR